MDISTLVLDGYVDRYANLAGCTLLLYDYLLTLDDERKPWSIGKVLFMISRYYSLIVTIAVNNYGRQSTKLNTWGRMSSELTYSLFWRFKWFRMPDSLDFQGIQFSHWQGWSGLITCMIVEKNFVINDSSTAAVWVILTRGNFSNYCYAIWIPRLAFDTLLCILALIRGFQLAKDESSVFESSTLPSGRILMKVLIRDCIGSYLILFTVYLTFLTIWSKNTNLIETCFSLSVAFESIVGTRTILRIRKVTTSGGPDVSTSMLYNGLLEGNLKIEL
ncbi:hypothetical protein F5879DRAFT_927179 [Lentinula edodes]|nr:hypothetical protein F5879DRAFT_927179 [Lentinula edodes]